MNETTRIAAVHMGGRFTYEIRVDLAQIGEAPLTLGTNSLGTAMLIAELLNDGQLWPTPKEEAR